MLHVLCSQSVLLITIIIRRFGRCRVIGREICFKTDADAELCMQLLTPVTRDQCPDSMTEFACPGGADHDRSLGALSDGAFGIRMIHVTSVNVGHVIVLYV